MAPTTEPDPYFVLGVARSATSREIRAAYRALGAKYHPDLHQGNPLEELASAKMAEINRAYEVLSDPKRRATFDGGTGLHGRGGTTHQAAAAGFGRGFGGGGGASRRLVRIVVLLSFLPLVLRFGAVGVRAVGALARAVFEGMGLLRGTPFAAGAALLAMAILVLALVRRRRGKARSRTQNKTPNETHSARPVE